MTKASRRPSWTDKNAATRTTQTELAELEAPLNRDRIRATNRSVWQGELPDDEDDLIFLVPLARASWGYAIVLSRLWRLVQAGEGIEVSTA